MNIVAVKEQAEVRVPLVPDMVKKLKRLDGVEVLLERGLSKLFSDKEFEEVGASITTRAKALKESDILLSVSAPKEEDLSKLKESTLTISFLDLFTNASYLKHLEENKLSSISLEMVPRTTLAQKMDAISSQASLAGYVAVVAGANEMNKIFPMMMTPSGTIKPAKVFIIGAGVAGLQAIASAKRLGANVSAFDTRPVVKEQVESLGAKFLEIDLGETGQTDGGYAKELTKEQLEIQQAEMAKAIKDSDLVITTAKLFGRKAPVLIKKEVLKGMKHGSVIVDLAASTGGNVEGTALDKIVDVDGVKIVGYKSLESRVAKDASIMLANNFVNMITHFWDSENNTFSYADDEILQGCLVTKDGVLVNESLKKVTGG